MWDNSASAYVDLTDNINTNTAFNFISDAADAIYIGVERRFIGIYVDLSTIGGYTGVKYEYLRGEEDARSVSLIDSYTFDESRYCRWNLPANWACMQFTSTFPHSATPPDTVERFWIKISVTAVTSAAVISKIRLMPYATYTTPEKVARFLQTKVNFDEGTIPTDLQVEDFIRRQEDYIDYRTKKSWRLKPISEETEMTQVDFNRYGIFLRNRNFYKVYDVSLWNGNNWQKMVEGRNNDYFVNYDLGIIYMTRLFMLPAIYGVTGRYYIWGNYRDWETDRKSTRLNSSHRL